MQQPEYLDEREQIRTANDAALTRVLVNFPVIHIRPDDLKNWRPTIRSTGSIKGILDNLTILCTDGNLAWFWQQDADLVFCGHVQQFDGEVKPLHSIQPSTKQPRQGRGQNSSQKRQRKTMLDRALDILRSLQPKG